MPKLKKEKVKKSDVETKESDISVKEEVVEDVASEIESASDIQSSVEESEAEGSDSEVKSIAESKGSKKTKEKKNRTQAKDISSISEKKAAFKLLKSGINKVASCELVGFGQAMDIKTHYFSSSSFWLDYAVGYGFPKGRFIMFWGTESSMKSTLAYKICADAQKRNRVTGEYIDTSSIQKTHRYDVEAKSWVNLKDDSDFIECNVVSLVDIEGTFDRDWARSNGLDCESILYSAPDYGEQAVDLVESLINSQIADVILVDSIAMLTPIHELENSSEKQRPGDRAVLMNKACRKWSMAMNAIKNPYKRPLVIMINQLRQKIGVLFGCFPYNMKIQLADGTTEKIGKIVNQKIKTKVLSMDFSTGNIESRDINKWFKNPSRDDFIRIWADRVDGPGNKCFIECTPNHLIFTPVGEVEAMNLSVGDEVCGKGIFKYSIKQMEIAIGSIIGDGSLRKSGSYCVQLRIGHGKKQDDYCRWKQSLFGDLVSWNGRNSKGGWSFDVSPSCDLFSVYKGSYVNRKRFLPDNLISSLTYLSVAIWYMDDANFCGYFKKWGHGKVTISCKSYSDECLLKLVNKLDEMGLGRPTITKRKRLVWSGERTKALQEAICKYIHPSMQYKIHPEFRGNFCDVEPEKKTLARMIMVPVKITKIEKIKKKKAEPTFDLEIEGNHSYIVGGICVHNSPDTRSSGMGQGFLTSIEIKTRQGTTTFLDKEKLYPLWVEMKGDVNKNKCAPPKVSYSFNVAVNDYDPEDYAGSDKLYPIKFKKGDIIELRETIPYAAKLNLIVKEGNKYCLKLPGVGEFTYDKKSDLLDEWFYKNEKNYATIKRVMLKLLTGRKDV